jgi:hypothetical protein
MIPSAIVLIASASLVISVFYDLISSFINDGKQDVTNPLVFLFRFILSSVAFFISYETTSFWWITLAYAWCILRLFAINYFIFIQESLTSIISFRYSLLKSAVIIIIYYLYGCFNILSSHVY